MVCQALALALALVLVAAPGVVHADSGDFSNSALHTRKPVSGQLPLEHPRLMRPADLDPAHPEQVRLAGARQQHLLRGPPHARPNLHVP